MEYVCYTAYFVALHAVAEIVADAYASQPLSAFVDPLPFQPLFPEPRALVGVLASPAVLSP